jgi:hypothetical protein
MKKLLSSMFVALVFFTFTESRYADDFKKQDIKIKYKYGVAFINGKAAYIDINKLIETAVAEMTVSKNWIKKHKMNKEKIIKAGRLFWGGYNNLNVLSTYDVTINDPYDYLVETKIKYQYNVKDNAMYLSEDGKEWDKLEISIINEKPDQEDLGPYTVPIFMIIHLKCKWFEGEYEIIGSQKTGS